MTLDLRNVAEAFPPGEFILEELEARGWTQEDLAEITGRGVKTINNLVNGKRAISPDMASDLAAAFGTSAQLWMNLESAYMLYMEKHVSQDVAKKAKIYGIAPVKEIIRRGWIQATEDIAQLEKSILEFLEIGSLEERPELTFVAKSSADAPNPSQIAWVSRARKIAKGVHAARFSDGAFQDALTKLQELRKNPEDARYIPRVLAEGGVRFVVIESLSKGKIDGACFWLDKHSPVIAISMRYDRLDHFWYILAHESGHIVRRDALGKGPLMDLDLVGEGAIPFEEKPEMEKQADVFAENFLVDRFQIEHFITRTRPLYSKQKILNFAARIKVHPAIVLGQLQHRGEVGWDHSREMLVKIRDIVISTALTDGWGHHIPADL